MAKVKVLNANFPYTEITIVSGSIFIKTSSWQMTGECVPSFTLKSLEVMGEDNVKRAGSTMGWTAAGAVVAGPVGAIAGAVLGGNKKDITFMAELSDNRKFIGTVDSKSYTKLKANMPL